MKRMHAALCAALALAVGRDAPHDQTLRDYRAVSLAGFTVLVSPDTQADPATWERLEWRLEDTLREARAALPPHARRELAGVRIWVEGSRATADAFHTAYYIRRAAPAGVASRGDILITQPQAFIQGFGQGNVLLHELAHAFDDRQYGMQNPAVQAAFEQARRAGLYQNGEWTPYAVTNAREYFAELSSAYFLRMSAPPLDRARLKRLDPAGYAAIEAAWSGEADR
ncbi:hypothetical protein [Deinococcus radiotolerans]|uniref:Metallopeptidase n=1 Tax=Deinococcus radiotolerans TaxID=1309407 RepID=A0ABQ2FMS6_9DEIO|nr:hypothetical protein [Deinococcus radiotolerans]GGL05769.1 hypothetical protein GCM10010844_25670 [Deinococcus radiotolerans]